MQTCLDHIYDLLIRLNRSYTDAGKLLKLQIDAVVYNRLNALLDAMEELITHQEETSRLETQLREKVAELAGELGLQESPTLGELLTGITDHRTDEIRREREQLISNIREAGNHHEQLMQLLHFAQDHTNETLRSIHVLANHHDLRYNQNGTTASTRNKTFAVNQTA